MSEVKPLVAVHCLVYNHEPYLRDCFEGFVMQQTNFPFVAIVHDDASTDGSAAIVREYENKYPHIFKPIYEESNLYSQVGFEGINQVMNTAIDASGAKYIAMCEGDDYWTDPLKLQKQVDFMEANPEYGMHATAFQQIRNTDSKPFKTLRYSLKEISLDDILKETWIATMTVMFRVDVTKSYTPPFKKLLMGDLPLWGHIALKYKIGYSTDVTAVYRVLESSASHFSNQKDQYIFEFDTIRVRDYYAKLSSKQDVIKSLYTRSKNILNLCYENKWFDFPLELLWDFLIQNTKVSGFDKVKYFGLKNRFYYSISQIIIVVINAIKKIA
ncbi:MAG: glycosyltransferase [Paludibacteraceae bacterium]|nr:glycosyltransferase [Paludibacteraceae bacterium]